MKTRKGKRQAGSTKTEAYQKLVSDLRTIIEDAKAKGVDFNQRDDILRCAGCGAYEDIEAKGGGKIKVFDKDRHLVSKQPFIIIDDKKRCYHRKKFFYSKATYLFICTVCGMQQTQIVRDKFEISSKNQRFN